MDKELSIIYTLANRGRNAEIYTTKIAQFLASHQNIICVIDEADDTDKEKGLSGRSVIQPIIESSGRTDLKAIIPEDPNVATIILHSDNIKIPVCERKFINKLNLLFPQGVSEHYQHHRTLFKISLPSELDFVSGPDEFTIITQHQSAFIRPFSRAFQAFDAMRLMKKHSDENHLAILIRDQNTSIPGEGRLDYFLQFLFGLKCLTKDFKKTYEVRNLEADSGGLNLLASKIIKSKYWKYINKIITIALKIESICINKNYKKKVNLKAFHLPIAGLDHGIIGVCFRSNSKNALLLSPIEFCIFAQIIMN